MIYFNFLLNLKYDYSLIYYLFKLTLICIKTDINEKINALAQYLYNWILKKFGVKFKEMREVEDAKGTYCHK